MKDIAIIALMVLGAVVASQPLIADLNAFNGATVVGIGMLFAGYHLFTRNEKTEYSSTS